MEKIKCDCGHTEVYGHGNIHSIQSFITPSTIKDLCDACIRTAETIEVKNHLASFQFANADEEIKYTHQ